MDRNAGFVIVEILIALVILSVGVLGMVTTSALVSRMIAQGQRYSLASSLAAQQFEMLRAVPCSEVSSGTAHYGRISVAWTVSSLNAGAGKAVAMTVTTPTGRGDHSDAFASAMACS